MRQIETAVLEDQVVDWVLARAHVTDRASTFAELTGFGRVAATGVEYGDERTSPEPGSDGRRADRRGASAPTTSTRAC